jgi:hypothetical protein
MKMVFAAIAMTALAGCSDIPHPLDCATGTVAWSNCPPGSKGYLLHQQSMDAKRKADAEKATNDPYDAADDAQCKSYGTTPGTDTYVTCRLKIKESRAKPAPPSSP